MAGKSTRITVDLGSDSLVKALRFAAVEQGRTVRDIVVEALNLWLSAKASVQNGTSGTSQIAAGEKTGDKTSSEHSQSASADKDYLTMMENLNRYRGL